MSRQWYGNISNRLEEGRQFTDEIKVGTGITEYGYSDRHPYEVIAVKDQKHITIRRLDHKHIGDGCMDNNWELISNPANAEIELVKRGNSWYQSQTCTAEDILKNDKEDDEKRLMFGLFLCGWGFDREKILEKGKQTKFSKMNISIGRADYYYDYEF